MVPGVDEKISYSMPTFTLDGLPLRARRGVEEARRPCIRCLRWTGALADEVAPYRGAKDAMHLPLGGPSRTSWSDGWSRYCWSAAAPGRLSARTCERPRSAELTGAFPWGE